MKNILRIGLTLALLLGSTSVAFADPVSEPGAPTDPQPFTVTCGPYTTPFVAGGLYMPSGDQCVYTIPQQGQFKAVGIYKGVVGNSVVVRSGYTNSNPATTFSDSNYDFSSAIPGDNYFAASYSGSSFSEILAVNNYLEQSGSFDPSNSDLTTVAWKWGEAPAPTPDTTSPTVVITSPLKHDIYAKSESVFLTATITDASPIASTKYLLNGVAVNPANPLPLASAPLVNKATVVATDSSGNTATSTVVFFVVKSKNSCLLEILSILAAYKYDKTLPDKPTLQNLIESCGCLFKGIPHHNHH